LALTRSSLRAIFSGSPQISEAVSGRCLFRARSEGIFCGVSSGGAVAGALRVAAQNPGAVVVAIICDRGDRYLSTGVFGEESYSQGAGI
jgi:tryptophan synthase beta subunit